MYEVSVEKKFLASHNLRQYKGSTEAHHEHYWKVQIKFRGKKLVQPEEYLIDFAEVNKVLKPIIGKLENKDINKVFPFDKTNPTAENISRWIYEEFSKKSSKKPCSVTVWETEQESASYIP